MTRPPDLHDLFGEWLSAHEGRIIEDPPRDMALHAAGCAECLGLAAAIDTLGAVDVAAAGQPPLRGMRGNQPDGLGMLARYAVIGATLALSAGTVAVGSSWLAGNRAASGGAQPATPGGGVLAGVPSESASPRVEPRPRTSASERESPSVEPSATATESPLPAGPAAPLPTAAPAFVTAAPNPTASPRPLPTAAPTATPTPPTPTPSPPTPSPTPSPPTPSPTPTTSPPSP